MTVDLSQLGTPDVIETLSFETLLAALKADLVARYPDIESTINLESEPTLKLLEVAAYRELQLRARYNDESRALLLAFATGTDLDHIGATYYQEARLTVTSEDTSTTPPTPAVMETDDDYRYRLSLKPESYSVAGPRDAFKFHALSADGQIKDASVVSPYGGTTKVYILSRTGDGTAAPELIATVQAALNDETIRPLSEEVIVAAGTVAGYALDIGLILYPGASTELAVAAAEAALAAYAADHHKLGADIVRSAIDAAAHNSGVKEVIIRSPEVNVVCDEGHAPYCTALAVAVDGIEA